MDEMRTTYCCRLEGFDSSKQPFKMMRSRLFVTILFPHYRVYSKQISEVLKKHPRLECFKLEPAAIEETFLLKDTSRGEDLLPPGGFRTMERTNNPFGFSTLLLVVHLKLEKNRCTYC